MKLYIAICEDRPIDAVVRVFDNPKKAIAYVKKFTEANSWHPKYIKEIKTLNWLYCCGYSCEDGYVRVEEVELNQED